ncbi:hypothetical protein AQ938_07000 [Burkholderia pseudomallei]|uniref:hypothetical protein n=1 Tax=Burkholderia pseudomallei TaxID=28450 RepID=UPI0009781464|nr:hypothetical protein [Burkholderia pseudomallei]OND79020.1 hypothetical protein AQ938_07000 [Burkholderia pseudomallei]
MREFNSLTTFAAHLIRLDGGILLRMHAGLDRVAAHIERTAKAEIGQYQPAVGPFDAWAPLAEATKDDRVRNGFPEDEPLLRTGEMRDSISRRVRGLEAEIGSTSDKLVYQELGTANAAHPIPPRPVLGPAAVLAEPVIRRVLIGALVSGLLDGGSMPAGLIADYESATVTR